MGYKDSSRKSVYSQVKCYISINVCIVFYREVDIENMIRLLIPNTENFMKMEIKFSIFKVFIRLIKEGKLLLLLLLMRESHIFSPVL